MISTPRRLALALTLLVAASACTSSLDQVEKLSQVDIPAEDPAMAALPTTGETEATQERARGLFGTLFRPAGDTPTAAPAQPVESKRAASDVGTQGETTVANDASAAEKPRGGFLGLFSGGGDRAATADDDGVAGEGVEVASIEPQAAAPRRGGLFGRSQTARADDGLPLGTVPSYGDVGRVCSFRPSDLGREVARYPERGPTYRIYDSSPGSTARRAFYVTGFDDGCVRVFSGALAMFGSAEMHEQLRYGLPAKVQPYSTTDKAYEQVKSRICRVGRGKPCGNAMRKLERDTVFVSVYENFGSNARWANMLLSDGDVVAQDIKTP